MGHAIQTRQDILKYFNFLLQAIACYVPKFLWDSFEGGLLRTIVMGMKLGICHEEEKSAKKKILVEYMLKHLRVSIQKIIQGSLIYSFPYLVIRCLLWF